MYFLDHVVHYTTDPSEAVEIMKEQGLYTIEGGHNARILKFGRANLSIDGIFCP